MQNQLQNINKTKQIKIISQGAYGCIFKPGFTCKGDIENDKFITKIQSSESFSKKENKSISEKEILIGKKIQTIKNFNNYFAPILDSCQVTLSSIHMKDELKQCGFLNEDINNNKLKQTYESNKIEYVGKFSLTEYLKLKTQRFFPFFINTYVDLLDSLLKLMSVNIIHFDLKENNIICRDKDGKPIIIDFGLSIDADKFQEPNYSPEKAFFVYGPDYGPWCIDICFLTYISNQKKDNFFSQNASFIEIEKVVDDFFKSNTSINELFDVEDKNKLRTLYTSYFKTFENKSWKSIYDELLKFKFSWDNYSLACIYLYIFNTLKLESFEKDYPLIQDFKSTLKNIIFCIPSERPLPKVTLDKINSNFNNVSRTFSKKIKKDTIENFNNPENKKQRDVNVKNYQFSQLNRESKIYASLHP
jgi:serine/threonine protein kinase